MGRTCRFGGGRLDDALRGDAGERLRRRRRIGARQRTLRRRRVAFRAAADDAADADAGDAAGRRRRRRSAVRLARQRRLQHPLLPLEEPLHRLFSLKSSKKNSVKPSKTR